MKQPTSGQLHFAERLLATERRPKRLEPPTWWTYVFNISVVTSFLFFFLM